MLLAHVASGPAASGASLVAASRLLAKASRMLVKAFRLLAEAFRQYAGAFRQQAETFRQHAEAFRQHAGSFRQHAKASRQHAEASRQQAKPSRQHAEAFRQQAGSWPGPRPTGAGPARTFGFYARPPMENAIKFLRIQNFKSIKDVTLHPRRVNLIIGEPNVGKSNLLEAMTLLGSITYEPTERFLGSFIRYEEPRQLFYDNLVGNTIKVETDRDVAVVFFDKREKEFGYFFINNVFYNQLQNDLSIETKIVGLQASASEILHRLPNGYDEVVSEHFDKYRIDKLIHTRFQSQAIFTGGNRVGLSQFWDAYDRPPQPYSYLKNTLINQDSNDYYLAPPYGTNLVEIIQNHPALRQEISRMFERYGQKLQLRVAERKLEVIKDQDGMTYSYPYSSVADTLQRIIFYLAAIESNDDAVLLFEEPEAHSFPVYVARLGRRIAESRNNQFFVDTHSPYLVTELMERMLPDETQAGELAIFAAYYDDHQTKLHQLSDDEVRSIREDGIDVFYNMKRFTTSAPDA